MTSETKYTCDVCKKKIDGPYAVMTVDIRGEDTLHNLEVCGWTCLKNFVVSRAAMFKHMEA